MNTEKTMSWDEANQAYLLRELGRIRAALALRADQAELEQTEEQRDSASPCLDEINPPPAIERLCRVFGLSRFEKDVLLLCAGVELEASFARLIAAAQNATHGGYPTFSLALTALGEPHWSALSPAAPLRRWRLIEVGGESLTQSRIRIDERVLHFLAGVTHLDERLNGLLEEVAPPADLAASHRGHAEAMVRLWSAGGQSIAPIVQLCGNETQSKREIAATACAQLGLNLYALTATALPAHPAELDAFLRLWQREAILSGSGLLIETGEGEHGDAAREIALNRLLQEIRGVLIVSGRTRRGNLQRAMVTFDIEKPTTEEQRLMWRRHLGAAAMRLNGSLELLPAQFNFDGGAIRAACTGALNGESGNLRASLWEACRAQARPQLNGLAQRIEPKARWGDLVLPEAQKQALKEIAVHVRQRSRVYDDWGFAAASSRGLGISALFAGPSGTGKTMAGEVLANELNLDLFRIDLSQVVNKYIGETEKNLRRVFDAAEEGGAILLFDEADALFGKRSEVKDSHDRYANIEVSYLLQRMEAYRGLAILTTNLKSALDTAFLRRLRFVVQFPFPDTAQRVEIWRRVFPAQTPTDALDFAQLARLPVAGGNIRNMALNAAFVAAEAGEPVRMVHLLLAAKHECQKLERPISESEIGGWR
jgi:ATP-dependent 26S proteasome regulatory subunit